MNKIVFLLAAFTSLQLHASNNIDQNEALLKRKNLEELENNSACKRPKISNNTKLTMVKHKPIHIYPKISLTDEEMQSPEKNKIRNGLLFGDLGIVANLKEFLEGEDQITWNKPIHHSILDAINTNNLARIKKAMWAIHQTKLKRALLAHQIPGLMRCLPENKNHVQDFRDKNDGSMLHWACLDLKKFSNSECQKQFDEEKKAILQFIINKNVDIDDQDDDGDTALHCVLLNKNIPSNYNEYIKLFKDAGANMNIQNKKGETLIFLLADVLESTPDNNPINTKTLIQQIETLVLHGADINIKRNDNKSFLEVLRSKFPNNTNIITTCQNLGAQD